jgi:mono/diheme cytochrome c family protein
MKPFTKILALPLLAAALTGCGSNEYTPAITSSPEKIYIEACQSCHGERGEGKFGVLLSIAGTDASIEKISTHIVEGGPVMPAFPNISQPQALLVAAWIKTL